MGVDESKLLLGFATAAKLRWGSPTAAGGQLAAVGGNLHGARIAGGGNRDVIEKSEEMTIKLHRRGDCLAEKAGKNGPYKTPWLENLVAF